MLKRLDGWMDGWMVMVWAAMTKMPPQHFESGAAAAATRYRCDGIRERRRGGSRYLLASGCKVPIIKEILP